MSEPSLFDRLLECGCRPDVPEVCDLCQVIKPEVERLRAKLQAAEMCIDATNEDYFLMRSRAEAAEAEVARLTGAGYTGRFGDLIDIKDTRIAELEAEVARLDPAYVKGLQARFADQSARIAELEAQIRQEPDIELTITATKYTATEAALR